MVMKHKSVCFSLLVSASLFAQSAKQAETTANTAVLQELVSEVRQLRQALERSTATSTRMQVLLQRLQLQNQRLNQATSRLESARDRITQLLSDQANAASAVRLIPERIAKEPDSTRKRELENQLEGTKALLERLGQTEAQLRGQETEADAALHKERTAWEELGNQLTLLEQSLTPIPRP